MEKRRDGTAYGFDPVANQWRDEYGRTIENGPHRDEIEVDLLAALDLLCPCAFSYFSGGTLAETCGGDAGGGT